MTLLIFGLAVIVRGLYAVVVRDVTDTDAPGDGRMVGDQAARYGIVLVVFGTAISAYSVFQWSSVTTIASWLHSLG
jgi:hypothetical protein